MGTILYTMRPLFLVLALFSTTALAQDNAPLSIVTEQAGGFTNYRAEGSLASTQTVGCIPLAAAKNTFTPADLYRGVAACIAQENYEFATGLFALAGIYGRFDAKRVADKSAGQARVVLIMNTFATVAQDKKTKFAEAFDQARMNPAVLGKLCGEVRKIGMPNYYPNYMILHGIEAFTGNPHEGALLPDFDSTKVWADLQTDHLRCPA